MSQKVALITGASRRLGLYLVEHLLSAGWQVIALTRKSSSLVEKEMVERGIVEPEMVEKGVAEPEMAEYGESKQGFRAIESSNLHIVEVVDYSELSIKAAINDITGKFNRINLLVHNASIYEADERGADNLAEFYRALFQIHMQVPALLNEGLSGLLFDVDTPGNIIHITDIYADNPREDYALYCSTKAGLENLNKSYAKKLAPGVKVNAIQPGPIKFLPSHSQDHKQQVMNETLLQQEGGFSPILQMIYSLIDNPYVTGTSVKVDGGRSLKRG